MAVVPQIESPTLTAIKNQYESRRTPRHGYRLAPSQLGRECERSLWYGFRWVIPAKAFSGQMIRLFETGEIQEERIVADLRAIGLEVEDRDANDPDKQISVVFADGHAFGYLDGECRGVIEAPVTIHVLEAKSHNAKSFANLIAHGVKKSKPEHYAQCMIYMHKRGRERALYVAVNKDTDELYIERIEYDFSEAAGLERKAERIAQSPGPLPRISENPEFYVCRFCDHAEICRGLTLPEKNCRTCAHVTPIGGGKWVCDHLNTERDREQQEAGCDAHLWNPGLIEGEAIDARPSEGWVSYALPDGRVLVNRTKATGGDYYD